MNPNNYNPIAREAFARSLIDIGVAIFKGVILLLTIAPLAAIFRSAFDTEEKISFLSIVDNLTLGTQWLFISLLGGAFILGYFFRKEGLRHLHEMEGNKNE
jgi:predicted small integral membrane protein